MELALEQANCAALLGEVPVGAVVVRHNTLVARAFNQMERRADPCAHAEYLAMRLAAEFLHTRYLQDCDLYVTLEPCTFCAAACSFYRIRRLYYGAFDPKRGAVDHGVMFFDAPTCCHVPQVIGGVAEHACQTILCDFFTKMRAHS